MAGNAVAKTGRLSRLFIRLDRLRITLWLSGLIFFTLIVPPAFSNLYGNGEGLQGMVETMRNPAMTAMVGPGNLDNYTIGAMTTHQMLLMTALIAGLMGILLITRHTRADEEEGRVEIIRSLPAGRLSNLNAAIIVLAGTSLALALITGFGLYALGIDSLGLEGSLLYGAALGGTALVFSGVAAVIAQLAESSRGTLGISIAILLFAYLLRAIGDVSNPALSWLSPLGWVTATEAYSANNWGPILLMFTFSVALFAVANYLNAIRDMEAGFLPSKTGKRHATRALQSPVGLAFRLQRTGAIAWAAGVFVLGASYGSVFGDLEAFFAGNDMLEQMLVAEEGFTLIEQFIPTLMIVLSLIATIPPVMAMNKLVGEEKKDRIEHLLSRAVSRIRLMAGYLAISAVNGFIILSLAAIGLWAAGAAVMDEPLSFDVVYGAAMVYYPAMLVMIGLAVFLAGFLPGLTSLVWVYVLYSFFVLYLGNMFDFPDWVGKLSPFGHVPQHPIEEVNFLTLVVLTGIAIILAAAGLFGYRKRDIG